MADKQLEIVFPDDVMDDGTPLYHFVCGLCKDKTRPCYGLWYCSRARKKKKKGAAKDGCDENT